MTLQFPFYELEILINLKYFLFSNITYILFLPFPSDEREFFTPFQEKEVVRVNAKHETKVKKIFYQFTKDKERLLEIPFTTLTDYLWLLKTVCHELRSFGPQAMLYLAAAVSDFYIPNQDMVEHKIQSSDGAPSVQLKIVPKMLAPLVKNWVPDAFVVSFKLETDEAILIRKAKKALATYQHRVVVANLLHNRKEKVILVYKQDPEKLISMSKEELDQGFEIEEKIVKCLQDQHLEHL